MTVSEVETNRTRIVSNRIPLADNIISVEYFYDGEIQEAKFYESQIVKTE